MGLVLGEYLIVGTRQSGRTVDCRARGGPAGASLAFEGGLAPIALDVHLENGCVMNEAVDGRQRHGVIREDLAPLAERLVGGDEQRASLVSRTDELEEHTGLGLILGDVCDVVKDDEVVFVELGDGSFQGELAASDLKLLDEVRSSGEEHAPTALDESEAERSRQVAFAATAHPKHDQIATLHQPAVP